MDLLRVYLLTHSLAPCRPIPGEFLFKGKIHDMGRRSQKAENYHFLKIYLREEEILYGFKFPEEKETSTSLTPEIQSLPYSLRTSFNRKHSE